jgi:hypothetical protein
VDILARALRVDPSERPSPAELLGHPFFLTAGGARADVARAAAVLPHVAAAAQAAYASDDRARQARRAEAARAVASDGGSGAPGGGAAGHRPERLRLRRTSLDVRESASHLAEASVRGRDDAEDHRSIASSAWSHRSLGSDLADGRSDAGSARGDDE